MRGFVQTPATIVDFMVGRLFRGRSPKSSDTVLDPGCGTGAFIEGIIRCCRSTGAEVPQITGVELESGRAKQAMKAFRPWPQVRICQADFLGLSQDESFDFIIGNPPYVSILELSEKEKDAFRASYETARGRFDLYLLFFERALKSLRRNGRMVFITPEKFL